VQVNQSQWIGVEQYLPTCGVDVCYCCHFMNNLLRCCLRRTPPHPLPTPRRIVPVNQSQWIDVEQHLSPGTEVKVRVHKISEYPKYRWES
jgi:hypothetical protein